MANELHELLITDYDIVEIVHDGVALIEANRRAQPDAIVKVTSSDPELAGVISDIAFVSAGQSGGAFDVFTVGSPTARDVTLTASYDGVSVSRVLSIGAAPAVSLSSLSVNAPSLRGGEGGIATVSLASPSTATRPS